MKKRSISLILVLCFLIVGVTPAYAADLSNSGVPEGCIAVSQIDMTESKTATANLSELEEIAPGTPNAQPRITGTGGTRVLSLAVYPLGVNTETGAAFYHPNIGDSVVYGVSSQSETIRFSNTETLQMMSDMMTYMSSLEGSYALVGWYFTSVYLFESERPQYVLYHPTSTFYGSTEEVKDTITSTSVRYPLSGMFLFPQNIDPLTDYYYIGFDGAYYYRTSNGTSLGTIFGGAAAFNSQLAS